ncbi:MAG: hypothetical protein M9938_11500 [Solirubrobacterales bacterium]|nr:hypothetical protein [Solirubrobacterales bacterium]
MTTETLRPADAKAAANGVSPNGRTVEVADDSTFGDRIKDPAYQAYFLLRVTFIAAPLLFGLDKFFNLMVDWPVYLAHWYNAILPGSAATGMHLIGIVEIAAAILVAAKPRYAAYVVAAWLAGIILDLLTLSGFYDVALRDFGLLMAALALARLAWKYDPPRKFFRF